MTRRNDVIEAVKGIIEIINKNINEGITGEWDRANQAESFRKFKIRQNREEEINNLIAKADDAHCRVIFEKIIESGKTRVLYQKRRPYGTMVYGTMIKYLGNKQVLIKTEKGGLVKRNIGVVMTENPMDKTIGDFVSYNRGHMPITFYYAVHKAYRDNKIPKTWQKYV